MQVELRVRKMLAQHGLLKHGVIGQLASDLGIHRHSARKLINGDLESVSLRTLGQLCQWLRSKGVEARSLPQALFGYRAEDLWQEVARKRRVACYLGEYQVVAEPIPVRLWISQRDVSVASAIAKELNAAPDDLGPAPNLTYEYVPFRVGAQDSTVRRKHFDEDSRRAGKLFQRMREGRESFANIMIGSQCVNYVLECWVAEVFNCEPFVPQDRQIAVPFYFQLGKAGAFMKSCFGGLDAPPAYKDKVTRGLYYLDEKTRWVVCPKTDTTDAGLVAIVRDGSTDSIEMAISGLSGRATAIMADKVVRNTSSFWPPYFRKRGKELGIYVCRFTLSNGAASPLGDDHEVKTMTVDRISEKMLKKFT